MVNMDSSQTYIIVIYALLLVFGAIAAVFIIIPKLEEIIIIKRARKKEEVVLHTKLSPEECIKILRETDCTSGSTGRFRGEIREDEFELYKVYNNYRAGDSIPFHGRLIQEQNGTTITGHFGIHPETNAWVFFLIIWLGVFFISSKLTFYFLIMSILCIFLIILLIRLTRGRYEKKLIIDFLRDKLEAK
jgi:hypothetical protein